MWTKNKKQMESKMTWGELDRAVFDWAVSRNLINKDNIQGQTMKVMEELGELCRAINKNKKDDTIDSIGDVLVTIIILSYQLGLNPEECLEEAYKTIKDRKGVTVNGVFIKE